MKTSLRDFNKQFLDAVLELLWRQWTALGVAGHGEGETPWMIDPEALLLATCTFGRYEPRLFDEVLDWLRTNGWVMNTQRLGTVLREESWGGGPVLAAVAGLLNTGSQALKWRRLGQQLPRNAEAEGLFRFKDGQAMPVVGEPEPHFAGHGFRRDALRLRGYSQPFRPLERGNLLVQLRALCGVNVRAEIIGYLLTHETGHPAEIARAAYFHKRTIQDAMGEMNASSVVALRPVGREKHYWIRGDAWQAVLQRTDAMPQWVGWPAFWSGVEQIWLKLSDPQLETLEPLMLSSVLRQVMVQVRPMIDRAGAGKPLSDDRLHLGETYLPVFMADVINLLGNLKEPNHA
jgi:hypothetical protein